LDSQTKPVQTFIINTSWIFSASVLASVAGIIVKILLARYLGPTGLGHFTLALYFPELAVLFLRLGLPMSNIYFVGSGQISEQQAFSNSISIALLISLGGMLIYLTILPWIKHPFLKDMPISFALIGAFSLPLTMLIIFTESILQGKERLRDISLVKLLQAISWLSLVLLVVVGLSQGTYGALVSFLLRDSLTLTGILLLLLRSLKFWPTLDLVLLKKQLTYGLKGHLGSIVLFFNFRFDILFITFFLTPREVGIYSLAVVMSESLWKFADAVQAVIFPRTAATQGSANFTLRVQTVVTAVTVTGSLLLIMLGKPVIGWLFSKAFEEAYVVAVCLCPGIIALTFAKIFNADLVGRGYPWVIFQAAACGLPFTLLLNPMLIPLLGIQGAAITSSISYIANGIFSVLFFSRICKISYVDLLATINPWQWWKLATTRHFIP
jgi:O-antigen/teichoic acid export membrane protein